MDLISSVFQQAITKFTLTKAPEMSVQLSNEALKGVTNFNFSLLQNAHWSVYFFPFHSSKISLGIQSYFECYKAVIEIAS